MKKLLIALFAIATLAACSKDEKSCTQEEFVGVYTGTADCDGTVDADYTITLTAGSDDKELDFVDSRGLEFTLKISGCDAKYDDKFLGVGNEIKLTRDDDGSLSGFTDVDAFIFSGRCDIAVSK